MSVAAKTLLPTAEEYLAIERVAQTKSEYHDGQILARAGGIGPHSQVAVNFTSELRNFAKAKGCIVFNSDMKLRIRENNRVCYPDVSRLSVATARCMTSEFMAPSPAPARRREVRRSP